METVSKIEEILEKLTIAEAIRRESFDDLKKTCTTATNEITKLVELNKEEKAKCDGLKIEIQNLVNALGQELSTNNDLKKNLEAANLRVQHANKKINSLETTLEAEKKTSERKLQTLTDKISSAMLLLKSFDATIELRNTIDNDLSSSNCPQNDSIKNKKSTEVGSLVSRKANDNQQKCETNVKQAINSKKMKLRALRSKLNEISSD
jgi:hypothetical protein